MTKETLQECQHWHCLNMNRVFVVLNKLTTDACPACGGSCMPGTLPPREAIHNELDRLRDVWLACKNIQPSIRHQFNEATKQAEREALRRMETQGNYLHRLLEKGESNHKRKNL